jgi:peptidoglycan/LPS O-acetylase OafA/YrhL
LSEPKSASSIVALDLLRGAAALAVMLGHVRDGNWVAYGALPAADRTVATANFFFATRLGHEAVLVFFVLSGFLVGGNLIERVRNGRFQLVDYAVDRTTRILIPLAPACALTLVVNGLAFGMRPNILTALGNAVGLNGVVVETLANNPPLWSLAFEIWFYVLAGALAVLVAGRAKLLALAVVFASVAVFAKLGALYVLVWGGGAIIVTVANAPKASRLFLPGLILALSGILFYQLGIGSRSFAQTVVVPGPVAEAMIGCGTRLCVPYLCGDQANAVLAPCGAPIRFLSEVSFSLYLVHYPINAFLCSMTPRWTSIDLASSGSFLLKAVVSFAAAVVFWLLFEKPSFAIRRQLKRRLTGENHGQVRFQPAPKAIAK